MSKVKIQGNASGTGVVTLTAPNTDTDRTITLPDSTGTVLDSTSTLDATKLSGDLPAIDGSSLTGTGKVLQVVSTTKTDTYSTSGDGDISGLTATITPSSTSSKILITAHITGQSSGNDTTQTFGLKRDSTYICQGNADGSRPQVTCRIDCSGGNFNDTTSINYLDSPSTTSAITYTIHTWSQSGHWCHINKTNNNGNTSNTYDSRTTSTITVMEIGA